MQCPRAIDLFAAQVPTLTRCRNVHFPEHLANDYLDVLVVDLHALQAIDILNLPDQVISQVLDTLQAQDVMRIRFTVSDDFTPRHLFAFKDVQMSPFRDQLFLAVTTFVCDNQPDFAFRLLAKAHRTGMLRHDRRLLWLSCLEQVSDTW